METKNIRLYHHKTDGGAEYLFDTFIECKNGHKEGVINDKTKYIVRIDGDITKDAELTIKKEHQPYGGGMNLGRKFDNWFNKINKK